MLVFLLIVIACYLFLPLILPLLVKIEEYTIDEWEGMRTAFIVLAPLTMAFFIMRIVEIGIDKVIPNE